MKSYGSLCSDLYIAAQKPKSFLGSADRTAAFFTSFENDGGLMFKKI